MFWTDQEEAIYAELHLGMNPVVQEEAVLVAPPLVPIDEEEDWSDQEEALAA